MDQLALVIREHEDRCRLLGQNGLRGRGFRAARLALTEEIDRQIFLRLLIGFTMRRGTEFLVLQLAQGTDLLPAVKALHAVNLIE